MDHLTIIPPEEGHICRKRLPDPNYLQRRDTFVENGFPTSFTSRGGTHL